MAIRKLRPGYEGVEPYDLGVHTAAEQIEAGEQREEIDSGLTKPQAIRRARALLARMKGAGWHLRVWQNLGWHYKVSRGTLHVHPVTHNGKTSYWTILGHRDGGGDMLFHMPANPHYSDPNVAVAKQLAYAKKAMAELQGRLREAIEGAA